MLTSDSQTSQSSALSPKSSYSPIPWIGSNIKTGGGELKSMRLPTPYRPSNLLSRQDKPLSKFICDEIFSYPERLPGVNSYLLTMEVGEVLSRVTGNWGLEALVIDSSSQSLNPLFPFRTSVLASAPTKERSRIACCYSIFESSPDRLPRLRDLSVTSVTSL
ncbi:hypothetical protein PVK06_029634 [Gossypium arboreum]|uniref:Uncharacterized protein n=1 Tax=Gossypium arboreum TaxID=29729 RepID=A0ABR0P767_GOSAR|nr:hypothetical protein PVK06_029634 [Gossypium arboreum]